MRVCVERQREQGGEEVNKGMEGQSQSVEADVAVGPAAHSSHMSPDACEVRSRSCAWPWLR